MADIYADPRENASLTEAQILAAGIKSGENFHSSDTKRWIHRSNVDGKYYDSLGNVWDTVTLKWEGSSLTSDYIDLTTGIAAPSRLSGRLFWDDDANCPAYYNQYTDATNQIGRELWLECKNATASLIPNGTAVYISGIDSNDPTISLADNTAKATATVTIGFTTVDIAAGGYGEVTLIGRVNNVDTSTCTTGDIIYLDVDGQYTKVAPLSPNYVVRLGTVGVVSATVGTIECNVQHFGNRESVLQFYNGTFLQDHTVSIDVVSTNVVLSLSVNSGTILSPIFNGEFTNLDYTTPATVNLTQGTDTAPLMNYVYLDSADDVIKTSTTGFPTDRQICKVAKAFCPTYTKVSTYGMNFGHSYTDHFSDSVGAGHLQHLNSWVREQPATYVSGMLTQATGGAGVFDISVATGMMLQLHEHTTPAYNTATGSHIQIYNDFTTAYKVVTSMIDQLTDSTGATMSSKSYSLFFWLVSSEDDEDSQLMCNLPSGSYNNSATAITDLNGYTNRTIPTEFRGVGIPLARVTVSHATSGNTYTIAEVESLRGSGESGGGTVGATPPLADVTAVGATTPTAITVGTGTDLTDLYVQVDGSNASLYINGGSGERLLFNPDAITKQTGGNLEISSTGNNVEVTNAISTNTATEIVALGGAAFQSADSVKKNTAFDLTAVANITMGDQTSILSATNEVKLGRFFTIDTGTFTAATTLLTMPLAYYPINTTEYGYAVGADGVFYAIDIDNSGNVRVGPNTTMTAQLYRIVIQYYI